MPRVAVLQVQAQAQQRGVLLHQRRDLHLDLVAQHLRPLRTNGMINRPVRTIKTAADDQRRLSIVYLVGGAELLNSVSVEQCLDELQHAGGADEVGLDVDDPQRTVGPQRVRQQRGRAVAEPHVDEREHLEVSVAL